MKIVTIIGARPQFIKAAVVSRLIVASTDIKEIIIHTGQHFDANMSEVFFEEMSIPKPHYNININGMGHGAMTGQMLERIEEVLLKEQPDWVLVYGDTNSTLAAALAAKKLHVKLAHVEAGLRSFDLSIPEEMNRILTDRISDLLFCPTEQSVRNLEKEGFGNFPCKVIMNGDIMKDAALFYKEKAVKPKVSLPDRFVLATIHRAENTDSLENLKNIFEGLETISLECPVVIPLHPRTKKKLMEMNYDFANTPIRIIDPVGYLEMVYLLQHCEMVVCDSGGLQKEAYFFKKYSLFVFTSDSPWVELAEHGFQQKVPPRKQEIHEGFERFFGKDKTGFEIQLYGDGHAGEQILDEIRKN